jgi:hypothetical protein
VSGSGGVAVDVEDLLVLLLAAETDGLAVDRGTEVAGDERVVVLLDEEVEATLVFGEGPEKVGVN